MQISEHTRQINRFIGLCDNTAGWPSTLHEKGYRVQLIEQTLNLIPKGEVTPDVVAVSRNHNHVLVVDCKSGKNIDLAQEERYGSITGGVLRHFVDVDDESEIKHQFCYVDLEEYHDKLKKRTQFPFITFGHNQLRGDGDFGDRRLNQALCKVISLDGMREPVSYYPFSYCDEDDVIVPHVTRSVVAYLSKKENTRRSLKDKNVATKLLRIIHRFHKVISVKHKKQLTSKINEIIDILMSDQEFKNCVEKIEEDKNHTIMLQKLSNVCERIIKDYEQKHRITEYFPPRTS